MNEQTIQTHFIDSIARVLGDPPRGLDWAARLAEKTEGEDLTVHQLERAADRLVRSGGKTFPQFKTCLAAMNEARHHHHSASHSPVRQQTGIHTQESYNKAILQWIEQKRGAFVLKREDEFLWNEWLNYYKAVKIWFFIAELQKPERKIWTTPTRLPEQFDRNYHPLRQNRPIY